MIVAAAGPALLAAAAVVVSLSPRAVGQRRLRALTLPTPSFAAARPSRSRVRSVTAASVVILSAAAVAGLAGGVLAAGAGVGWLVVRRRRRRPPPLDPSSVALALDLLAACLSAGVPVAVAVRTAADAVSGAVGESLLAVAWALDDGAAAEEAWAGWVADPSTRRAARALVRAGHSGASPAAVVARAAAHQRDAARALAQRRVQAAGTWSVLPLGLCFLPAFVLIGVVPVVIGLVGNLR